MLQRRQDGAERQAGAFVEQAERKALGQAQRVHHELKRQVSVRHRLAGLHLAALRHAGQIGCRLFVAHIALDAVVKRQLAVRAGANAQIIAKRPVIQVVPRLMAGQGKRRGFVMDKSSRRQPRLDGLLHIGGQVVVGQIGRRAGGKQGVGLQRQVIGRQMARAQRQRLFDIGQRLLQRLAGQGVHDVQIEGVEVAAGLLGGAARFVGAMNAPQRAQVAGVKALHANRQPVYPRRAIAGELGDFQRAGVGFQGDFCVRVELEPGVQRAQQAVDMRRAEQAGRAAAHEHRLHPPAPDQGQGAFQVGNQRVDIAVLVQRAARLVRVEVAIRAFAHAPGKVNVQRQGRQAVQPPGGGARVKLQRNHACPSSASLAASARMAWPRWLTAFLAAASICATDTLSPCAWNSGS